MAKLVQSDSQPDMTPMIDMVFQLMIFFLVTIQMERDMFVEDIRLAKSRHGPEIKDKVPGTVVIEVDAKGRIFMGRTLLSTEMLRYLLLGAVNRVGYNIPVQIRGDLRTPHRDIRRVMDVCTEVGLVRLQFVAIQKEVTQR